ncbi:hypothetical protein [Synechococcus sp. 1G10]|uniref:hypothetical protein n=1 Tax=Synechococcus sp. 1G10 TaxID=2025605 RepID=UPI000B97DA18|nr:hypothetical protein [Synechococcus sp. 1G10]
MIPEGLHLTCIGLLKDGVFDPQISSDDRNAASFGLSRQQLAQRYLLQIRGAFERYRNTHCRQDWIRGTTLVLLALGFTSSGCGARWPSTNGSSAGSLIPLGSRRPAGLVVGGNQLLTADQL